MYVSTDKTALAHTNAASASSSKRACVMAGDPIVLQFAATKEVLILRETVDGPIVTKAAPETALLSEATWEVSTG